MNFKLHYITSQFEIVYKDVLINFMSASIHEVVIQLKFNKINYISC